MQENVSANLGIGEWSVQNWISQGEQNIAVQTTKSSRKGKISEDKAFLIQFLEKIPKMESHYCRKDTNKLYLDTQWTSVNELYKFYTNECVAAKIAKLNNTTFRQELDKQRIALFKPKKDQCDTCTGYSVGKINDEQFQQHLEKKNLARAEKEKLKEEASKDNSKLVLTMDAQAILTAPRLQVSAAYYKMKLNVHNYSFYNLSTGKGHCYVWHEGSGGVEANEFTSIIIDYIKRNLSPATKSVVCFSDGCCYQTRNVTLSNALSYLSRTSGVEIFQYYLEKGHTQMECDSIHACIERKLRNRVVYVPGCYVDICRSAKAKDPYEVDYLNYSFFKDYSVIKTFSSIRPGNTKGDPKVTDLRALAYRCDGAIEYKLLYQDHWTPLPRRTRAIQDNLDIPQLHNAPLKIKPDKFKHLQELKNYIPEDFRLFYDNLSH
uniref:Uncharacterized protein LOC114328346 n=2 Tax=Diabrotica virgifera virgifera TaxID=50390 RepID=A0A6P7GCT5_DIAVI